MNTPRTDFGFLIVQLKEQGFLEKQMTPELALGRYKISQEHSVVPENKTVIQIQWFSSVQSAVSNFLQLMDCSMSGFLVHMILGTK